MTLFNAGIAFIMTSLVAGCRAGYELLQPVARAIDLAATSFIG